MVHRPPEPDRSRAAPSRSRDASERRLVGASGGESSERAGAGGLVMVCDVDLEVPDATRTHTLAVAGGFAAEGLAVDLLTRGVDPRLAGVRHHSAPGSETERLRRIAGLTVRACALLLRRRRQARRCYVRHSWSNAPILVAARMLGYRVVTQVDDVQYGRGYELEISFVADHVKRLAAMLMGRLAHGVVAVTPEIKGLLVEQFHVPASRIAVLPNGVDVETMRPVPRDAAIEQLGLEPSCTYLIFCGRFEPWVDFDTMIDALAIVRKSRDDARLLLVGDGPERERAQAYADALGVRDAIVMTGFVADRARVRALIGAATVALASHRDGYVGRIGVSPTKLAEYMAAGRAVVAKDLPGIGDALRETGAGIAVPSSPQAMAEAILALLQQGKADELGRAGRRAAEQRYTWRSIVRRTLPLFDAA